MLGTMRVSQFCLLNLKLNGFLGKITLVQISINIKGIFDRTNRSRSCLDIVALKVPENQENGLGYFKESDPVAFAPFALNPEYEGKIQETFKSKMNAKFFGLRCT